MEKLQKYKGRILLAIIFIGIGILANKFYNESKSKEFLGCENYTFDPKIEKIDGEIFYLMEEKKYDEAVNLGNKHLKDDGIWYCDTFFWTQRAKAFYNLGICYQAIVASGHNLIIYPKDNNVDDEAKELHSFITNSDICITKY